MTVLFAIGMLTVFVLWRVFREFPSAALAWLTLSDEWHDRRRARADIIPSMRPDTKVGRRIKTLRNERGLSQRDIAGPGMSNAYISRIEAGERMPSLGALIDLAERLDTTALYLATGKATGCPFCGK